jgi:hypothetical protein
MKELPHTQRSLRANLIGDGFWKISGFILRPYNNDLLERPTEGWNDGSDN